MTSLVNLLFIILTFRLSATGIELNTDLDDTGLEDGCNGNECKTLHQSITKALSVDDPIVKIPEGSSVEIDTAIPQITKSLEITISSGSTHATITIDKNSPVTDDAIFSIPASTSQTILTIEKIDFDIMSDSSDAIAKSLIIIGEASGSNNVLGKVILTDVKIEEKQETTPQGLSKALLHIGGGSLSLDTVSITGMKSSSNGLISATLNSADQITIKGTNTITSCSSSLGIMAFSVEQSSAAGSIVTTSATIKYYSGETEITTWSSTEVSSCITCMSHQMD